MTKGKGCDRMRWNGCGKYPQDPERVNKFREQGIILSWIMIFTSCCVVSLEYQIENYIFLSCTRERRGRERERKGIFERV